ncbi:MAG TPA: glycosyltransferase family 39 protein, partial [Acidobacteriaceae bacterium]|nr:glycosyltransferase family 39 protein [Acidobacteriaceae bacterium]
MNQSSLERRASRIQALASHAIYTLALVVSISTWFIAFRAPLWTDETGSYWEISDGLSHIWGRRGIGFPAFDYILWVFTRIFGTSEVALRSLSIFTMLCATYLLYRIARGLFERDTALIAVIIFCVDPIVVFASIDVRPYAFAVLTVNAAIFILLRLRNSDSSWLAALFGVVAAGVV